MEKTATANPPDPGQALADLLEAVGRSGDRSAFAALFRHFAPRIVGYLRRMGADPQVAEELMQETMVMVWRRAATFDRKQASASTWLFTIARNKRIDALRRERRPAFDPEDPAFQPAPPPAADEVVDAAQREDIVRRTIAELPEEQAALLRRAFFEGLSHRELADDTGLPLGTVKSRLRLALGRMRRALGDLED